MSCNRRHTGSCAASRYWGIAIPVFVIACMLGVPFIGVLAVATFWAIPSILRNVSWNSPQPAVASASVNLTKRKERESVVTGPQLPIN